MNEDTVLAKLNEHDKRFDAMEAEFQGFKHQVYSTQDQMLTILRRLDEERIFTTKWVDRIEQEVAAIKAHLKIGKA